MTEIGSTERITQNRVINLFKNNDQLRYTYLGNWKDRENNSNIEEDLLRKYLKTNYSEIEITQAIRKFKDVADNLISGLYNANEAVYSLLRYGVNIQPTLGENKKMVKLIDWANPLSNDFYIAEEVTIKGKQHTKRPDLVIYVNGIALGVIELKRSTVSITAGIRQNLDNQKEIFIEPFFTTIQLVFAGNDVQGLNYGVVKTKEKFWLRWKEKNDDIVNELDKGIVQMFNKGRFLEFIRDFLIFDGGVKKAARPNQYFAVKASQSRVKSKESGIIWHSQGSGKSLTMVWLAKWIRKNVNDARVVIITDRNELDSQIKDNFKDSGEKIARAKSGVELIEYLNSSNPWLICSLIHKFGNNSDNDIIEVGGKRVSKSTNKYLEDLKKEKLPKDFKAKGNLFVFIDECHRTQGGTLHEAVKFIMGDDVMFIGFTGTPLLKTDKKTSLEVFGRPIHTYKFDEAVEDNVILDLRYEARDVEQHLGKAQKIDDWFEEQTKGLSRVAKGLLKERWVKLEKLFSSKERMQRIVADICMDADKKSALFLGYGNAMLVAGDIYQAYRYWNLFQTTALKDHCAVVTSYEANITDIKGETTGEGEGEEQFKYDTAKRMMGDKNIYVFEQWAKNEFIKHPASMKLLIVVDKLLTGFDAPSATYMYIDKKMRDHSLFQAICRVNRVNGENKEYGYIIDYQDLFNSIKGAIEDYTTEAFDEYDEKDVQGLLLNRLNEAKTDLDEALQTVITLCEVIQPQTREAYFEYFVYNEKTAPEDQPIECELNAHKREKLYQLIGKLVRRYVEIAGEMDKVGYSITEAENIKLKVDFYNGIKDEIKLKSGDALDLKRFDPMMRQLIDNWVRADDSEQLFEFDYISFLDLIAEEGGKAIDKLPASIKNNERSVAETILANMYKVVNSERPNNPAYYDKVSKLLEQLLEDFRQGKIIYKDMVDKLIQKVKEVKGRKGNYPDSINSFGKKALYDNLDKDEDLAIKVHEVVKNNAKDGWRDLSIPTKMKRITKAVGKALNSDDEEYISKIVNIIVAQREY